jgi:predicted GNAT superfamily acetyltransferase
MNIENVNLNDTEIRRLIKDAISDAFEHYLTKQAPFAEYDYGIDSGYVLKAEDEAFENIINYIKEL